MPQRDQRDFPSSLWIPTKRVHLEHDTLQEHIPNARAWKHAVQLRRAQLASVINMSVVGDSSSTPSSAAVFEFICLFTHDLRRKQKRWEDGRLKFHSFNNRVMVYDDRGSFVGDMHWRRDYDLGEGEEIELERGGIIVQVQDLLRRSEQDLSELIDKRAKEKEQRQLQAVARARGPTSVLPQPMPRPVPSSHFQLRHRPLHQLIDTPSGHHGRASVPHESPYESRQPDTDSLGDRAAKRRKCDVERPSKKGHAQALFGQTLTLSATPISSMPARYRPRKEPSSSASVEDDQRDFGQHREVALREQSTASLYFNRRKEDLRVVSKDAKNECLKSATDRSRSIVLDPRLKRTTIPTNTDVIEITDPSLPSSRNSPAAKSDHEEKTAAETSVKADANTKVSLSRRALSNKPPPRSLPLTIENQKRPKLRIEGADQAGKTSSSVQRPADIGASSHDSSGPSHLLETASKAEKPMIELRLKSKKKRGLLMMLDRPQRPGELQATELLSTAAKTFEEFDQVAIDDQPHPTPPSNPEQPKEVSGNGDTPAKVGISLGLGEEDDHFRSPFPGLQEQRGAVDGRPESEDDEKSEAVQPLTQRKDAVAHVEENSVSDSAESGVRQANALTNTKASQSSAQGHTYDPYQIHVSCPGEQPRTNHKESCISLSRPVTSADDSRLPVNPHINDEETGDSQNKIAVGLRRNRKARRNIVLDDDEYSESPLNATGGAEPSVGAELFSGSDSDVLPKQGRRSAKAVPRRKGRLTSQNECSELDIDDELIGRPRTLKRKTRGQRGTSGATSGSGEEASEQENFAKNRKKRVTRVSEERPRLTKVKNSVKSRELIGFDLSALKVPLGPRGIGLPFSILSSPANESTSKVDSQDSMPGTSPDAGLEADAPRLQSDASKPPPSMKGTVKMSSPTPISGEIDDVQSDQRLPTGRATAKSCSTAEPSPPGQKSERPQMQAKQETRSCRGGNSKDQNATAVASDTQHGKKAVDAESLGEARITAWSPTEPSKSYSSPPTNVSVDMSCQSVAPGLIKESFSTAQAACTHVVNPVERQPPTLSSQCEPARIRCENKLNTENDVSSVVNTAVQEPASKSSRDDSRKAEPALISSRAPVSLREGQPEVEKATPAAAETHQPRRTVGLRRTGSAVRSINNVQMEAPPLDTLAGTTAGEESTKPVSRIANPATRGRKAALKSHAAGQAPQRILPPTQPALLVPISTADLALTPIEEPRKEPERPKKKMAFPGFQSARGEGPWSREAFDLLESGRPE